MSLYDMLRTHYKTGTCYSRWGSGFGKWKKQSLMTDKSAEGSVQEV